MDKKNVAQIEKIAANAWRPESEHFLGGWLLRYSRGITRRGNSVLPLKDNGKLNLQEKISLAEEFYSQNNLPTVFQMTQAAQPNGLYSLLKKRGYQDGFHTQVQTALTKTVLRNTEGDTHFSVISTPKPTPEWLKVYVQTDQYGELSSKVRENILRQTPQPSCFLTLREGNHISAIGLGVIERNHMGIFCMVTPINQRRRGAATAVIHSFANWGAHNSVRKIYLQVMEDNLPALALYSKAGFTKQYRYWYSIK